MGWGVTAFIGISTLKSHTHCVCVYVKVQATTPKRDEMYNKNWKIIEYKGIQTDYTKYIGTRRLCIDVYLFVRMSTARNQTQNPILCFCVLYFDRIFGTLLFMDGWMEMFLEINIHENFGH